MALVPYLLRFNRFHIKYPFLVLQSKPAPKRKTKVAKPAAAAAAAAAPTTVVAAPAAAPTITDKAFREKLKGACERCTCSVLCHIVHSVYLSLIHS
jgi:hypothetical protein